MTHNIIIHYVIIGNAEYQKIYRIITTVIKFNPVPPKKIEKEGKDLFIEELHQFGISWIGLLLSGFDCEIFFLIISLCILLKYFFLIIMYGGKIISDSKECPLALANTGVRLHPDNSRSLRVLDGPRSLQRKCPSQRASADCPVHLCEQMKESVHWVEDR